MRLLIAIGGTVLLSSMLQGCQSADYGMVQSGGGKTFNPEIVASQIQSEQRPALKDQARAYAARLKRDGCIKSPEGATFEAAAGTIEKELAGFGQNQPSTGLVPGSAPETVTTLAEARLEVGDAASASGCLDIANVQYKAVIRSPGAVHASYKQRAELGLSASQL